jgi:hypothetical protein
VHRTTLASLVTVFFSIRVVNRPRPEVVALEPNHRSVTMLETIAIVLLILWVLGMVSSYTMGGLIHVLLVAAIVVFLVRIISGRRVV